MADINVKINSGDLTKLNKKIQLLKKVSKSGLSQHLSHIAFFIQKEAILAAPYKHGNLRQLIGAEAKGNTALIYSKAKYAAYQEFGTGSKISTADAEKLGIPASEIKRLFSGSGKRKVNMNPQPYFFPAVRKGLYKLLKNIEKDLKNIL